MMQEMNALNPGYAFAQIFSDLAEATMLFSEIDVPPEEYLNHVRRCHEDASMILSVVFTAMTDSVRDKIPEELWERHAAQMVEDQRTMTQEQRDKKIHDVLMRLAPSAPIEVPDEGEPDV